MTKPTLKQFLKWIFIAASISSLALVPWPIVKAWITPLPNTVQEQLNNALNYGFDGIIIYVDKGGEPSKTYTAGWHDTYNEIAAKPDALFKIASISKLYIAVAITKLVSNNTLSLDTSLAHYFPELKGRIQYADSITLRLMVEHRSGIPNYTNVDGFWANPPSTRDKTLELVLDTPASFKPNKDYEYSNTNYLLLRKLLDKVLGYNHTLYIKNEILTPLNLTNTYSAIQDVDINQVMSGYYVGITEDLKAQDIGMLATAEDVGKFLRALNTGSIFKDNEQDIYSSLYVYNHTGLIPGYQSIAKYHKDIDTVVIQFTNTTDFNGYHWNLSEINYSRILKILKS